VGGELDVLSTFEINREAIAIRGTEASQDALQLLNIFAVLHNQDIRFDLLRRAVTNAQVEHMKLQGDQAKRTHSEVGGKVSGWLIWYKDALLVVLVLIFKNRGRPVLPSVSLTPFLNAGSVWDVSWWKKVIRDGRIAMEWDPDRLRRALRQLTQFSLVLYSEKNDRYFVHPLVHKRARERPEMSTAEQAVWSEAATSLLSHCILMPFIGNTTDEEEVRKQILPHVGHVRECQNPIEQRMRVKRMVRMKPWPVFENGLDEDKVLAYTKFSLVYAQNGRWEESKRLQHVFKLAVP
jgi:hypothetical protein